MKKIFLLCCFALVVSASSYGQSPVQNNIKNITAKAKAVVTSLSENISVSSYQQKSTQKVLVLAAQELEKIENSKMSASEKTNALKELKKKKEYSLRMILNDQQYAMLEAVLEQ